MQQRRQAVRTAALVSPLVLLALFSFAPAQDIAFASKQQTAILASDKEITISLKMSDDRVIIVSQYVGEMIRTGPKEGDVLGIIPRIQDDGSIKLDFFRVAKIIKRDEVVGEAITSVGSMELNTTLPQSTPINLISSIQLVSISKLAEESDVRRNSQQAGCCVTCGGEQTCGLSVQVECGSCR